MSSTSTIKIDNAIYANIRAALSAAGSGSVIDLGTGRFNITKSDGDPSLPEASGSFRPTLALSPASNLTIRGAGAQNTTIVGNARIYSLGRDGGPPPNGLAVEGLRFLYDSAAEGYLFSPSRGSLPFDPASPTIAGATLRNVSFEGEHPGAGGASGTYMDISGSRDITFSGIKVSLTRQSGYDPITGTGGGFFIFNEGGRNLRVLNSEFRESGYSSSLISLFNPDTTVDSNRFLGAGLIKQDDDNDPANNPRGERFYNAGGVFANNYLSGGSFFDYLFFKADQGLTWQDYKSKNPSADGTYGLRTKVSGNSFDLLPSGYGVLIRSDSPGEVIQRSLAIEGNTFGNGVAVRSELTSPFELVFGSNTVNGTRFDSLHVGGNGNDRLNESRDNGKSKWISGGPGNDDLYGSSDARDAFIFWAPLNLVGNVDTIYGFKGSSAASDQIWLSAATFGSLSLSNAFLDQSSFTANSTGSAIGGVGQITYNTSSGDLSYDADGEGGSQAIRFARLVEKPALSSSNFLVFGSSLQLPAKSINLPAREGSLPFVLDRLYPLSPQDPIGNPIRDFDGNPHGFSGGYPAGTERSYKYQGQADVNGDGSPEQVFTNRVSARWATASIDSLTGQIDYSRHGQGGSTRVVGIYIDPLVAEGEANNGFLLSGEVAPQRFGPFDSQQRFQNDLRIDNLELRASADYDGDGLMETYWKVLDGTAYLHAYMHADGNIQYANYQNLQQMNDFLTPLGYANAIPLITA